ncbi:hypothetical protein FPV67DRAFT_1661414 [Lyophyllum atratum]|nr:hypothetical protein FPV67DRAFT_1661414 [Lyophyllum atratum]
MPTLEHGSGDLNGIGRDRVDGGVAVGGTAVCTAAVSFRVVRKKANSGSWWYRLQDALPPPAISLPRGPNGAVHVHPLQRLLPHTPPPSFVVIRFHENMKHAANAVRPPSNPPMNRERDDRLLARREHHGEQFFYPTPRHIGTHADEYHWDICEGCGFYRRGTGMLIGCAVSSRSEGLGIECRRKTRMVRQGGWKLDTSSTFDVVPPVSSTTTMPPTRNPSHSNPRPSPTGSHPLTSPDEWYHDRTLTISEYARKAVSHPPPRAKLTQKELERYTEVYVKCILLAQAQNEAMAHDPGELRAAYGRVEGRLKKEGEGVRPLGMTTYAQIDAALEDYEEKCKRVPESFDNRILLATYAMNYLMLMVDHVLGHPTRHKTDNGNVLKMATDELAKIARASPPWASLDVASKPIQPTELIPAHLRNSAAPVLQRDLEHWRAHPQDLVGLGFIPDPSRETEDSVFFVRDYVSTARRSRYFELQFEDSGEDVFPFGEGEVFELVGKAEYVHVEAAPAPAS